MLPDTRNGPGRGAPDRPNGTATKPFNVETKSTRRSYIGEADKHWADRERVLGAIRVHRDPVVAAHQLEGILGRSAAMAWLDAAFAELEGEWSR